MTVHPETPFQTQRRKALSLALSSDIQKVCEGIAALSLERSNTMADSKYFGYVVTILAYIETVVGNTASTLYASGRKRIPGAVDAQVTSVEELVVSYYLPARSWVQETGTKALEKADQAVDSSVAFAADKVKAFVPECAVSARDYWVEKSKEISAVWQEQGVLKGTYYELSELAKAVHAGLLEAMDTPFVKSTITTVKESAPYRKGYEMYTVQIEPVVTKVISMSRNIPGAAGRTWTKYGAEPLDAVKEKLETATDYIVGQPAYAKSLDFLSALLATITSLDIYKKAAGIITPYTAPYVNPLLGKITATEFYVALVDRLTPIKQE